MSEPVYIIGAGVVTSIGMSLPATTAAVRANLDAFRTYLRYPAKRDGRPLKLALLPAADKQKSGLDRMLAMGLQAAEECLGQAYFGTAAKTPIPVFLSVPPERPGFNSDQGLQLAGNLMARMSCQCDEDRSGVVATGHQGGLALLQEAMDLIGKGQAQVCLVGGVESFDSPYLDWLDGYKRLKADDAPHGIIPGEGAAFVLIASGTYLAQNGLTPTTAVHAALQGAEPHPWYSGEPGAGQGLSDVLVPLLFDANRTADAVYCDHTGENWRGEEWSVAYLRTGHSYTSPLDLRHPADCWGDLGAATGTALLALAHRDLTHATPDEPQTAAIFCASDMNPYRSGAYLSKIAQTQRETPA